MNSNIELEIDTILKKLNLETKASKWYKKQLMDLAPELQTAKVQAMNEILSILVLSDQKILCTLFNEIYLWHTQHKDIQTDLPQNLYFACGILIPIVRCPYLETLHLYDVYL